MTYVPDVSAAEPEVPSKPTRDPALDVWRIGVFNDDATVVTRFYKECLETTDDGETRLTQSDLAVYFNEWREEKGLPDKPKEGATFNQLLFEFLAPRYKNKNKKVFFGIRIVLSDEEIRRMEEIEKMKQDREATKAEAEEQKIRRMEKMEKMKQDREAIKAEAEEQKRIRQYNMSNPPETPPSSEEEAEEAEPQKKKEELKEIINWNHKKIHRHPVFKNYGADLITGEIVKLKKNNVLRIISIQFKSGSTTGGIVLEGGKDEDGKRIQQYFSVMKFIAECGKLKGDTKFHTKLMFNRECEAYIKRPIMSSLPLACISYEYDGGLDFNGDINRGVKSGNALVSKCKTTKQIDEYIAGIKEQYENNRKADKLEILKLKALIAKLEKENKQLNTPLNAGAVQLREVLLTKLADGSTVLEMLHLANKDITYGCIKDESDGDGDPDDDLIFGLPECGLPDRNEIITR
jgi:actin-related protein